MKGTRNRACSTDHCFHSKPVSLPYETKCTECTAHPYSAKGVYSCAETYSTIPLASLYSGVVQ